MGIASPGYGDAMGDNLEAMAATPEMVRAQHVTYSVRIASEIAAAFAETVDREDLLAAAAMVDAFYVHIRLLAEFLTKPVRKGDIGPADFGVDWTRPDSAEARRLGIYWTLASQHVVHFGGPRVPAQRDGADQAIVVGHTTFEEMARDTMKVHAKFLARVVAAYPPVPATTPIPVRDTDLQLWRARVLADRSRFMVTEFRDACTRLGLDADELLGAEVSILPQH